MLLDMLNLWKLKIGHVMYAQPNAISFWVQNNVDEVTDKVKEVVQEDIWGLIKDFLELELLHIGPDDHPIVVNVGLLLLVVIAFVVTSFLLRFLRHLMTRKMSGDDRLKFISVFKFVKYIIYIFVIVMTLSAAGINVTVILTASAALFVGLGLALQELFQDIIAGIFIIVDKSLMVGDIIEVDSKVGRVIDIKLRTTRAITRDDKIIIIPNHKFIEDVLYNYTQNHRHTREVVQVGVAYGSDTELVRNTMLDCAKKQQGVLKSPEPFVLFEDFGDSALAFGLYFYVGNSFVDPRIKSDLRFAIDAKFRENNISIPFPQRDLHIINVPKNESK